MGRKGSGNREGENVLCPLFIVYRENEIQCESHIVEARSTIIRFADRNKCRMQKELYCEKHWKKCEQYLSYKHFIDWEDE